MALSDFDFLCEEAENGEEVFPLTGDFFTESGFFFLEIDFIFLRSLGFVVIDKFPNIFTIHALSCPDGGIGRRTSFRY